jgi:hypothetical protein
MTDFERSDLAVLAPLVDETKSRALFDARRRHRQSRRRALVAVGVVTCLLVGLGSAALLRDADTTIVAGPAISSTDTTSPPAFAVLAVQQADEQSGMLRAATDTASLLALWEKAGLGGAPPAVDFDRWVVVSMTIPDDACPATLTSFEREDGPCMQLRDLLETFVVSIDPSTVGPMFTVRLPARTSTPIYRGQPSIDLVLDEARARAAGLIPPECIETDGASICLGDSPVEGLVALRAANLQPGSMLTVIYPNGESDEIPIMGDIITSFGMPTIGTMLRVPVSATTAAGTPIQGTVAITP